MALVDINWNPSHRDLRVFAALQMAFFAVVAAMVYRRTDSTSLAGSIVAASLVAGAAGLAAPRTIRPIYLGWMAATWPIGWVVSHVILAAIYFGVFTPYGLLLRAVRGDRFGRRLDRGAVSHWVQRPPPPPADRYFRQY